MTATYHFLRLKAIAILSNQEIADHILSVSPVVRALCDLLQSRETLHSHSGEISLNKSFRLIVCLDCNLLLS